MAPKTEFPIRVQPVVGGTAPNTPNAVYCKVPPIADPVTVILPFPAWFMAPTVVLPVPPVALPLRKNVPAARFWLPYEEFTVPPVALPVWLMVPVVWFRIPLVDVAVPPKVCPFKLIVPVPLCSVPYALFAVPPVLLPTIVMTFGAEPLKVRQIVVPATIFAATVSPSALVVKPPPATAGAPGFVVIFTTAIDWSSVTVLPFAWTVSAGPGKLSPPSQVAGLDQLPVATA